MLQYAELEVTTNFSFLHSASHAEEIIKTADALGLSAIAVTGCNTLAGVVRAYRAAKETSIQLIVGSKLDIRCAISTLLSYRPERICPAFTTNHPWPAALTERKMRNLSGRRLRLFQGSALYFTTVRRPWPRLHSTSKSFTGSLGPRCLACCTLPL